MRIEPAQYVGRDIIWSGRCPLADHRLGKVECQQQRHHPEYECRVGGSPGALDHSHWAKAVQRSLHHIWSSRRGLQMLKGLDPRAMIQVARVADVVVPGLTAGYGHLEKMVAIQITLKKPAFFASAALFLCS